MRRDYVRLKIVLVEICTAFENKYTADNNIQVNNVVCPDFKSFSWAKTLNTGSFSASINYDRPISLHV